jgi:hypothetical protein
MVVRAARWLVLPAVLLALAPAPASACGGLFCDRGPSVPDAFGNTPPVQAGEQIVYGVESDGSLVMTVRILYNGAAPEFAWILPVPTLPVISLGTDALFSALDTATTPSFSVTGARTEGSCAPDPACEYDGPSYSPGIGCSAGTSRASLSDSAASAADAGASGPHVESMGTVGPYDTVVLSGGTGAEVVDWLTSHGYAITPASAPLLDAYAMHGSHFVALRLHGDASVVEIQPVTLTMPATAPCLPIRLTALATAPDLPITAFFLGDGRAVSTNYSMLAPAYDDAGLYGGYVASSNRSFAPTTSYASYVTREVRAAGGHAFVTDFAGRTPTLGSLALPSVLDLATAVTATNFIVALQMRGYLSDPQILAILPRFIGPPAGMTARAFYSCLASRFSACGIPTAFDPAGAAMAIDQAITQPRRAADALIGRHPYTSRLFTTMSAADMTVDPEFRLDPMLGDAPSAHAATAVSACDASVYADEAGGFFESDANPHFGSFAALPHADGDAWCQRHRGPYYRASRGCGCGAIGIHRPPSWLVVGGLTLLAALVHRARKAWRAVRLRQAEITTARGSRDAGA